MSKKNFISTDLFKGKTVPPFIKDHSLFRNPVKIQKVFPSIGMPNFKDKASIDKCFVDLKKEGSFVHNLFRVMLDFISQTRESTLYNADKLQYLDSKDLREKERLRMVDLYTLCNVLTEIIPCVDPYDKNVLDNAIQVAENKISLKLIKDVVHPTNGKMIFKKGKSLFSVFNDLKERCEAARIAFPSLEANEAFKTFSKENIPNKEFSIIFSSEGEEGAWDIATMSMRGIKSCQRWDGEYPRCLIGSILSKFVGVMYLTSGVQSDNNAGFGNLGTKMMRRCVVRYVVDADENKPCILIDKMYPELDKDVLSVFIGSIKSRTNIPVYYAQDLGNKIRHMYIPSERIREEISDRDWSYQDSPLKSKNDFNIYILTHKKEELEREVKGFKLNLALFLARKMESAYSGDSTVDGDVKKTISNIRMNTSFTPFCESAIAQLLHYFKAPQSHGFSNSKSYYKKYLRDLLTARKQVMLNSKPNIAAILQQNTSRTVDSEAFMNYILSSVVEYSKQEITRQIN